MGSVPADRVGNASGILGTFRQLGSVLGVAVMGAILEDRLTANLHQALAHATHLPAAVKARLLSDMAGGARQMMMAGGVHATTGPVGHLVAEQFVAALHTTVEVAAGIALLGAVAALFIQDPRRGPGRPRA